ncbi:hypothetical protein Patl1_22732 [Pistacia atlantica]|uniref:Uncharacterized protein n=1 Tax=Pistacia atlantica TaxID=434234 RepID=A0ACC0ZYB8_9ROSI|nr:hypothetical protein Patl1_22732 [Pistacia atlantica]
MTLDYKHNIFVPDISYKHQGFSRKPCDISSLVLRFSFYLHFQFMMQ